jgi:tetratricopeptide (TPR) repeat protein
LIEDHAPEAAKAERSAQVGRLFARAGASWVAERWFEQALHMRPNDLRTAHDLLHLHTSRGDAEAVARLATEWVLSPSSGRDGAEWLTSIALARISFGDLEGAAADLQAALRVDPIGDRAAAALLELGISADRWDWIDDALRQIRNRAAEAGDGRRAFEAAACLVAVGEPTDADRIAFDLVRREGCEPRPDQIEAWMHDLAGRPEAARPRVSGTPRERSQTLVEFALSRR